MNDQYRRAERRRAREAAYLSTSRRRASVLTRNENSKSMSTNRSKEYDDNHGIRSGYYLNQIAWFECICGEEVTGQTSSWEDTGRELDLHLKGVSEAQQAS